MSEKQRKNIPGPGAYNLKATEIGQKGHYVLSNFKYLQIDIEIQYLLDIILWEQWRNKGIQQKNQQLLL